MEWDNKKFILCLTHDVDRVKKSYQYFTHFIKTHNFYHIKSFFSKENPYWNFEKIMEIEEKYNVRSTFFFLNESIKFNIFKPNTWKLSVGRYRINDVKVKNIIKKLDKGGWEIGVHGSYNSYKSLELLKKEKEELERIVGHEIIGIRQHYLNINENTWNLQIKAGFKYDSSFGSNVKIGWKDNKYTPFCPIKDNKNFIEIPLVIQDFCLMSKKNVKEELYKIINLAKKNKAVLTVNWHQSRFNESEFPNYIKIYEDLIKKCKELGAKFMTCREVYEYFVGDETLN